MAPALTCAPASTKQGDEGRPGVHPRLGGDRRLPIGGPEEAGREPAVEQVAVHLDVLLRRADVDPVALVDVGDEGLTALGQGREVGALDR